MIEIYTSQNTELTTIIITTPKSLAGFRELVQRGSNLWPDAPPEIKETADIITNGQILQNYRGQDTSKK